MIDVLLTLYHWWQLFVCALPLPWTFEIRETARLYETEYIESVVEEVTPHVLSEREISRIDGDPVGFAVVGWRLSPYTQFADIAREHGDDPKRDVGIDWAHGRSEDGPGDPCWPNEGRIHVRLHIECGRRMERMMERKNGDRSCPEYEYDGGCWYYTDPVEMCYRGCWIAGKERLDDRCEPR